MYSIYIHGMPVPFKRFELPLCDTFTYTALQYIYQVTSEVDRVLKYVCTCVCTLLVVNPCARVVLLLFVRA